MIRVICAVRDRATVSFGQPIFVVALGEAHRSFVDEVNRDGSPFNAHPEDYDLYELGTYDDGIGRIVMLPEGPRQVAIGKDLIRSS